MVKQEKFLSLNLVERLPRLSSEEESRLIKLCYQSRLELLDPKRSTRFPLISFPNIEVLGMPNAGKTTLLTAAVQKLNVIGLNSSLIEEQKVPFDKDDSPTLYALTMFQKAADVFLTHEFNREVNRPLLLDGGVYKQIAFLKAFEVFDEISSEDAEIAVRYIERFFGGYIDGLIICYASPELSLARQDPWEGQGRVMNPNFLTILQRAFFDLPGRIAELRQETLLRNSPLLIVELDSDQEWETYLDLFMKSIGSICHHFALGGINI